MCQRKNFKKMISASILLVLILLSGCVTEPQNKTYDGSDNNEQNAETHSQHTRLNLSFFKGIWTSPGLEERALEQDTEKMKTCGVNIFALSVLYDVRDDGSVKIVLNAQWEGNEEKGYINMIRKAHNAGLAVFLEMDPIYSKNDEFAAIPEEIKETFLENFKQVCIHWAEIAEQEQVEMFSPFNEPTTVVGAEDAIKWMEKILPLIRQRFNGDVIIKFAGEGPGDFSQYGSIEGYDYVALDIYAIDDTQDSFMEYLDFVIEKANSYVENYNLKGFIFGEMGIEGTNEKFQAELFQRFFERTWNITSGYFLCIWGPKNPEDPFADVSFTDKAAENIIKQWYTSNR
ncbi:MAG TPA: hypothetical protein ENI45_01280 [Thermoplasmatales archaeon]|nr:hypothetical protein [Thermoplasmatales archaeon]